MKIALAKIALGMAVALTGMTLLDAKIDAATAALPHRPCLHEDSTRCVWDARHSGNGEGHSFWTDRKGGVHYISHRRAHRLLFGRD